MKKIIYFVFAALALVACEPNNGATEKVRIGVSLDDKTQPVKGPQRISAIDGATEIEINWEEGDVLYYQLNGQEINKNNPFKIISGVGEQQAFFECDAMIGPDDEFTLYYHGAAEPNFQNPLIKDQKVTIDKDGKVCINNDYLMYKAINCKIGSAATLKPNFAILGVQIEGNLAVELATNKWVSIGEKVGDSWVPNCVCKIVKEDNATTLATSPILYFVFPFTDVITADYLIGKAIWFANDEDGSHECCNRLTFETGPKLIPGAAQIIKIGVNKGTGSLVHEEYNIEKL